MAGLNPSQRREVVSLILSLTSNANTNPGDLTSINDRLTSLEASTESLYRSISSVSTTVSDVSADLQNVTHALDDVTADLNSMRVTITTLQDSVSTLSTTVTDLTKTSSVHSETLSSLRTAVDRNSAAIDNLKSDVSSNGLAITDLQSRVKSLESTSSHGLSFSPPLSVADGVVSLNMDPYFCSQRVSLTSYSAEAQLLQFQWMARGTNGSSDTIDMTVNAHCHGRRTDYRMSSTGGLTVTSNAVSLTFDLSYITRLPSDLSRLVPSAGFQVASFPVDVFFTRDSTTHTYQAYGVYSSSRVFTITFPTGGDGPANIRFLTVRTGIDT
ncbi:sigma-C protein [Avian orthoreovirus]|uniref:Sigma-C protein n=1 Tax=Avian orthoreovirus TaxID=38170 RepID=A0A0A0QNP7_9REOV|nr:sigma-C protein [Avian orthoreovirus]